MREAIRRLLGLGQPFPLSPEPAAQEARAMCAKYLEGRIQSTNDMKPGRKPDMSPEATAALLAVLREVAASDGGAAALSARLPSDAGAGVRAASLAAELEQLAAHLKLGGDLTERQAKEVGDQLRLVAQGHAAGQKQEAAKSSACAIM